jgi:hypothetical protein
MINKKYNLNQEIVFEERDLNYLDRSKLRPLGNISNYVVEKLPLNLEKIRRINCIKEKEYSVNYFSNEIESIISQSLKEENIDRNLITMSERELGIARLDSQILKSSIIHSYSAIENEKDNLFQEKYGLPGEHLLSLAETLSCLTSQPEIITYRDIVRNNPQTDIRSFTTGNLGHSEASFYVLHEYIENELNTVNKNLRKVIDLSFSSNGNISKEIKLGLYHHLLNDSKTKFDQCISHMGKFMMMKSLDFNIFRQYLKGYNELHGASGLFSGGFVQLDSLLVGSRFPLDHFNDVEKYLEQGYYPQSENIHESLYLGKKGKSLTHAALVTNDKELVKSTIAMIDSVLSFRKHHYKAVVKKIPAVAKNEAPGTGIPRNSGDFLKSKMNIFNTIKIELERKLRRI